MNMPDLMRWNFTDDSSRHRACCEFAGWLAEHGVVEVEMVSSSRTSRRLVARQIDLPGELQAAQVGTLLTWISGNARIESDQIVVQLVA